MAPLRIIHLVTFVLLTIFRLVLLCEVSVPGRSWPEPNLLVPLDSTVMINCTLKGSQTYWTIDLANDGSNSQLQFVDNGGQRTILNSHGVYELSPVETTLRLLINDTENNNLTKIFCFGGINEESLETTLNVYDPAVLQIVPLEATPSDNVLQSSTISWNPPPSLVQPEVNLTYDLLVISENTQDRIFQTDKHYFTFTAPEDAPPCEVYNFSVTATYVGATYTEAGCSVPSPVLSTMLPSLPDVERLEHSINYIIKKESGIIDLLVAFQPANYCQQFPVLNYTLEVDSLATPGLPQSLHFPSDSAEGALQAIADNLQQDATFTFRLRAENSVGNVSTKGFEIYTTDVQSVSVAGDSRDESVFIHCSFISGTDASGCMVEFVGEQTNTSVNLTRKDNETESMINHPLPFPLSCYHRVFALDIEGDGSLGTLPVPAVLGVEGNSRVKCTSNENKEQPLQGSSKLLVGTLVPVLLVGAAVSVLVVVIIIVQLRLRHQTSYPVSLPLPSEDDKISALYAVPMKTKKLTNGVRGNGDGAEKDSIEQEPSATIALATDSNGATPCHCAMEAFHSETKRLDCLQEMDISKTSCDVEAGLNKPPPLPPPFNADSALSPTPTHPPQPVYQEIGIRSRPPKLAPNEAISPDPDPPALPPPYNPYSTPHAPPPVLSAYEEIDLKNSATPEPKISEKSKTGPVYHDIFDLPTSRKSSVNANTPDTLQESTNSTSSSFQPASKPLPVYQEIAELTSTEAPAEHTQNDSHPIVGEPQSTCNPYHTTTVTADTALLAIGHTEVMPAVEGTGGAGNLATDHTPKPLSQPKPIPIYQEISHTEPAVSDGNTVNHGNCNHDNNNHGNGDMGLDSMPAHLDRFATTTEVLPIPIYEDIGSVATELRPNNSGMSANPAPLSDSSPPSPLPKRGSTTGPTDPSRGDVAPPLPERGSPLEPTLRELTPPSLPERGTMDVSRDLKSTPPLPLRNGVTINGSHVDPALNPLLPERGTIGNSVEPPPPSPPVPLLVNVQTLLNQREDVERTCVAGVDDSSDGNAGGTLV